MRHEVVAAGARNGLEPGAVYKAMTQEPARVRQSVDRQWHLVAHIRTGAPWRDLPEKYGKWMTVYQRFRRSSKLWRMKMRGEPVIFDALIVDEAQIFHRAGGSPLRYRVVDQGRCGGSERSAQAEPLRVSHNIGA